MADKKISELPIAPALNNTGIIPIVIGGITYQTNLNTIDNFLSSGSSSSILDTDRVVTGGTYDSGTGIITYMTNSGNTFDVSGFVTGFTDTFVTGGTYDSGTTSIIINDNQGGSFNVTGITSNLNQGIDDVLAQNQSLTSVREIIIGSNEFLIQDVNKGENLFILAPNINTNLSNSSNVSLVANSGGTGITLLLNSNTGGVIQDSTNTGGLRYQTDYSQSSAATPLTLATVGFVTGQTSGLTDTFITGGTINFTGGTGTFDLTNNIGDTFNLSGLTTVEDVFRSVDVNIPIQLSTIIGGSDAPLGSNISVSNSLEIGGLNNNFTNGEISRAGLSFNLPINVDTDAPFKIAVSTFSPTPNTGTTQFFFRYGFIKENDLLYDNNLSAPNVNPNEFIITTGVTYSTDAIATNYYRKRQTLIVDIDISTYNPMFTPVPDSFWFVIERIADNSNVNDTFNGNTIIESINGLAKIKLI